jgi:FkbH-like protein
MKSNIKLVIWDLDETFWKGTLSEEGIEIIPENVELIKKLAYRGIVNSICSKNDYDTAKAKLQEIGVWDYFVFPYVDWTPKGKAVSDIIEKCQLRPQNVLFIDDNTGNINEVEFFNEGINTALPDVIPSLLTLEGFKGKDDSALSRLEQYKVLEKKDQFKTDANLNNEEFLKSSEITIRFDYDALAHIDRLWELEGRTNQLNFTKLRVSKEQLIADIKTAKTGGQSAALFVQDKYGDYGLVGFYVLHNKRVKHFVFSCRVLNMQIENYVYNKLDCPNIDVVTPVSGVLEFNDGIDFIQELSSGSSIEAVSTSLDKLLLVGGCDLEAVGHYFKKDFNVETDFNYINSDSYSVHKEHTWLLRLAHEIQTGNTDEQPVREAMDGAPFLDFDDVASMKIFTEDWKYLVYSPLNDYSRGVYQNRKDKRIKIPFELFNKDWTNQSIEEHELPAHLRKFTSSVRSKFSSQFDYIGPISDADFKENLLWLAKLFSNREIILLSGSEIDAANSIDVEMVARHKRMNHTLMEVAEVSSNVRVCDVREFISSSQDLTDNIRHYTRPVYFSLAKDISSKLSDSGLDNVEVSQFSALKANLRQCWSIFMRVFSK